MTLFMVAGTASGLLAGLAADRLGFKPIFVATHLMMTPALWWLLTGRGAGLFAGAFAAGFAVLASLPLGVTMAQQLAPQARSMVSSLMMGLAYGLGGSLTPLVGWLADRYGIHQVLSVVALVPLVTVVLVFFFPSIRSADSRSTG